MLNKGIQMIVFTNEKGEMFPARFKLTDDESVDHIFSIEKFQLKKGDNFTKDRKIFRCMVTANRTVKFAEIHYELATCKWTLQKFIK
jgi:hypothetical protein